MDKQIHKEALAKAFRKCRRLKQVKREYIAKMANVSTYTIDKLEQGKNSPDWIVMCQYIQALEMTHDAFHAVYTAELERLTLYAA